MFKGASLTDIKQLFLTPKEMFVTVTMVDFHLVYSDSEGWLENKYHAVFLFSLPVIMYKFSILYFLCEANRRMHELRDNEAQCAVSSLCFCNGKQ